MKYLFIIIIPVLISSFTLIDDESFQIEDGNLIWQKVHQTDLSKNEIINQIKISGEFHNINEIGENVTANISRKELDFKEMGESNSSVPIYIVNSDINAFVLFELNNDKYRVTVRKIILVQKSKNAFSEEGEMTNIESFALKNDNTELKNSFSKKPARILDYTLSKLTKIDKALNDKKW